MLVVNPNQLKLISYGIWFVEINANPTWSLKIELGIFFKFDLNIVPDDWANSISSDSSSSRKSSSKNVINLKFKSAQEKYSLQNVNCLTLSRILDPNSTRRPLQAIFGFFLFFLMILSLLLNTHFPLKVINKMS